MDDAERLKELEHRRDNILRGIRNIERDIAGAENALLKGEPPERLISFLRERNRDVQDHYQDLGATDARIEDLKNRQRERGQELEERQVGRRAEDRNPTQDGEQPWYRKPQSSGEPVRAPAQGEKPRNWFERDDKQEKGREDDRFDRDRDR